MKMPKPTTVDFETFPIRRRPAYPPIPVGVSIKKWGKKARYYAWGHPDENNCTWTEARDALVEAFSCVDGVLFQNAKFDIEVAVAHFGLEMPSWSRIHDTLFLLFLDDPHQTELGLKPSADRLLNLPPEERDAVVEWLIEHQPVPGVRLTRSKNGNNYAGQWVALAPGSLTGAYANGDVERTEKLFELLWPKTQQRGMLEAYDRERRLMPVLLRMEQHGARVDASRLERDIQTYRSWLGTIDAWIIKQLKCGPDINLDSGEQLAQAMVIAGKADASLMGVTKTGKLQTNKESLAAGVTDKVLAGVLKYRSQLSTCLKTFMMPWLETAKQSDGLIFTTWNQTKSTESGGAVGTRTGRLSSTPNFQNIPKEFGAIFAHDEDDKDRAKKLPKCPWPDLPSLPLCRGYLVPMFKDHILLGRDYSQQELRILGHFEGGVLMDAYLENPWLDVHDYARDMINTMLKRNFERKPIKNTGFGLIYGMGLGKLAIKSDVSIDVAKEVKDAYLAIFPGLRDMYGDMKQRARDNEPIHTWGGREYYCEPAKIVDGRIRQFDYKLVNVLVQGSAAECTKEALIRFYDEMVKRKVLDKWFLILQVHDEVVISVPKKDVAVAMKLLKDAMESVEFDVPMLSEGAWSAKDWASMLDYDTKGEMVDALPA